MQPQYTNSLRLIPTKFLHVFNVELRLSLQKRFIGTIDEAGTGKFLTKRTEHHLHRKSNSLGVNLELLQRPDFKFNWLIIDYCGKKLITSRNFILYHGSVFNFSKAGFEKQVFLKLDLWGEERAKAFESTLHRQGDLFNNFGEAA